MKVKHRIPPPASKFIVYFPFHPFPFFQSRTPCDAPVFVIPPHPSPRISTARSLPTIPNSVPRALPSQALFAMHPEPLPSSASPPAALHPCLFDISFPTFQTQPLEAHAHVMSCSLQHTKNEYLCKKTLCLRSKSFQQQHEYRNLHQEEHNAEQQFTMQALHMTARASSRKHGTSTPLRTQRRYAVGGR